MTRQEFYQEYKEVLQLDTKTWDMPKFGVVKYVKNLPFKVQVSLKDEIDKDSLYYVLGGFIYELDLSFLRPELQDETRFPKITKGKLNAIEVDSKYLTKHTLDKKVFTFNTKVLEEKFPIMTKEVKPIDDYIDKKQEYDIVTTVVNVNVSKEDNLILDKVKELSSIGFTKEEDELLDKTLNKIGVNKRFDECIENRLKECQELLLVKSKEYRRNGNPYHNFEIGSNITGETPEKVLYGFLLKHLISLQDIINDITDNKLPTQKILSEKVSDILIYHLILEALIEERRFNNE